MTTDRFTMYTADDVKKLWNLLPAYKDKNPGQPSEWPVHLHRVADTFNQLNLEGGKGLAIAITKSFDICHMSNLSHNASKEILKRIENLWEEPLGNIPRYVNDTSPDVSCLARWRLEVGK